MKNKILCLMMALALLLVCQPSLAQFNPDNPQEPDVPVFRYRISTSCSPEGIAWTSGSGDYVPGSSVWIHTSRYNSQYTFSHWSWVIDGVEHTSTDEGFEFTTIEKPVSFVAHYDFTPFSPEDPSMILKSRLYLSSEPAGIATFNCAYGERIQVGFDRYIEVYANQGYEFLGWFKGNVRVSEESAFYYTIPATDTYLVARFRYHPDNPPNPDDDGSLIDDEDLGDINGDGVIDQKDLTYLCKIVFGQTDEVEAADLNRDRRYTITDITRLIRILNEQNK